MPQPLSILWIKTGPLHPLETGGRIRTHSMLKHLSGSHRVTYLALLPENSAVSTEEREDPYAAEKIWVPWREAAKGSPRFFFEILRNLFFSSLPYAVEKYRSERLRRAISATEGRGDFDIVVCDFLAPAVNFLELKLETPVILFQHNVESQIWKRLSENRRRFLARKYFQLQFNRMRKWEKKLSAIFQGVITVSPEDTAFFEENYHLDNLLGHVETGVDTEFFRPGDGPSPDVPEVAFLGSMDWLPNIEAVEFFVDNVLPRIHEELPGCRLRIIGRNPAPSILRLAAKNPLIEATGTVDDVRPHLGASQVMVVPLLSGGGTRIKIFEAMALGIPVVSTSIGAEGLGVSHQNEILLADAPEDFAGAVVRLLRDPALREELSRKARLKVRNAHGWPIVVDQFLDRCRKVIAPPPASL